MDKKIIIEIFQGSVSLIILGLVIFVYFTNFTSGNENTKEMELIKAQNINYNFTNINNSYSYGFPTKRTIVLRMDDVQAYAWNDIFINITEEVLTRNMSIVLGVIPNGIETDKIATNYLLSKIDDKRIEIAQHGTTHKSPISTEYSNLSELETYSLAQKGLTEILQTLNIKPTTFIPPQNEYNGSQTTKALSKLGFTIISAKQNEYKYDGYMYYIGYTEPTKETNKNDLQLISGIVKSCSYSLDTTNICVIMIHPQDYVNDDKKSLNQTRFMKFQELLTDLNNLNASFKTFSNINSNI